MVVFMGGWRDNFNTKQISEARKLDVKIIKSNKYEVVAKVDGDYVVETLLFYKSPYLLNCSCAKAQDCIHEAAMYLYFEKRLGMLKADNEEMSHILDKTRPEKLKKFMLNVMEKNEDIKTDFLELFGRDFDWMYYKFKLDGIFMDGYKYEVRTEDDYDLDKMRDDLIDFFKTDIVSVLHAGEINFASELMCKIGEILMLESALNYEAWDDIVAVFLEFSTPLKVSLEVYGINHDKLLEIEEYIDKILY